MFLENFLNKYNNKNIKLFVDMDGVIADYDVGKASKYDQKRPLLTSISKLEKISKKDNIELYISELKNDIIPVKKVDKDNIDVEINNLFYFEAPVEKDEIIGSLKVMLNGKNIDVLEVKNMHYIRKNEVGDYLKMFLEQLCG